MDQLRITNKLTHEHIIIALDQSGSPEIVHGPIEQRKNRQVSVSDPQLFFSPDLVVIARNS